MIFTNSEKKEMAQMQGLTTLDFQILHAIQRIFSCFVLDFLMPKITALGNGGILWILLAILLLILPKTRKNGIQLGVGCVGCGLIGNLFLKNVIARNRPCWIEDHTMLIAMPTDFSFPSGHTMRWRSCRRRASHRTQQRQQRSDP